MNKTVAIIGAVVLVVVIVLAYVYLNTGGRQSDGRFDALSALILTQVVVQLFQLARTEQVSHQVNGRFSQQQEITRMALDVIPPAEAARITKDALTEPPAPDGRTEVESTTADQPPAGPAGQRGPTK